MTTPGKVIFVSVCSLVVAGGLSSVWINHASMANTDVQCQAAMESQARLTAQIGRLKKQTAQAEARLRKLSAAPVADSTPNSAVGTTAESRNPVSGSSSLVVLRKDFFLADAQLVYRHYFQTANLSPAQLAAVCERIALHEEQTQDLATHWPQGVAPSDPRFVEFQRKSEEEGRNYESDLTSLLGIEGLKEISDFKASQMLWQQLDNFAGAVYATDTPITADQAAQLFQVLKMHQAASSRSSRITIDVDSVLQEAAPLLSPLQFSILNKQLTAGKLWDSL